MSDTAKLLIVCVASVFLILLVGTSCSGSFWDELVESEEGNIDFDGDGVKDKDDRYPWDPSRW